MKHRGHTLNRYTGTVVIVRTNGDDRLEQISIKVQQLPIRWQEQCERLLPPPDAPIVGKDFDGSGNAVPKRDYEAASYKAEVETWQLRTWAKKIYDATIDPGIAWETDPAMLETDPAAFFDGIFAELDAAFSRGEIQRWILTINSIDQVGGADVALAEEGLFPVVARLLALQDMEEDKAEAEGADV